MSPPPLRGRVGWGVAMANDVARKLRRNPTEAEKRLWSILRDRQLGCRFRRQQPIDHYIVDFVCLERRLIVEVDGGQHAADGPARTAYLEAQGFKLIRFWNNEVLSNLDGVAEAIRRHLG